MKVDDLRQFSARLAFNAGKTFFSELSLESRAHRFNNKESRMTASENVGAGKVYGSASTGHMLDKL